MSNATLPARISALFLACTSRASLAEAVAARKKDRLQSGLQPDRCGPPNTIQRRPLSARNEQALVPQPGGTGLRPFRTRTGVCADAELVRRVGIDVQFCRDASLF